jgi:hypothetical protein
MAELETGRDRKTNLGQSASAVLPLAKPTSTEIDPALASLHKAMKEGIRRFIGCDKEAVFTALGQIPTASFAQKAEEYKSVFQSDLTADLKSAMKAPNDIGRLNAYLKGDLVLADSYRAIDLMPSRDMAKIDAIGHLDRLEAISVNIGKILQTRNDQGNADYKWLKEKIDERVERRKDMAALYD